MAIATRQGRASVPGKRSALLSLGWVLCCAACAVLFMPVAQAQTTSTHAPGSSCGKTGTESRPRIGVALGGGGARGIAHLSILRALENHHVPVDCIAGTSMGALVGGLYASGMSIDDMEKLLSSADWPRLFDDSLARPERSFRRKQDDRDGLTTVGVGIRKGTLKISPGMLQGQRILAMFEQATSSASRISRFDDLPIPYRAVATDLNSGEAVVLDHGSLALAMRASMSLPGIFQPVEIDDRVLLDGGLVNQVPIDVVREMGADIVVAVDVGTPLDKLDRDASLLSVISQITGMMTTGNTARQLSSLNARDVLIVPRLGADVKTGDFEKVDAALAIGAVAAEEAGDRLEKLGLDSTQYAAHVAARPALDRTPPAIEFVRIENQTGYADELLLSYVPVTVGKPLDTERVENGLLRAYSMGTLSSITYEITEEDGRTGVLLRARPKPQGPNYLQLGMTLSTDFEGAFESNLRAALLFSPLTPFGAEGRVGLAIGSEPGLFGEIYYPLDVANRNLLYGKLSYDNPNVNVFDSNGRNIATYDVRVTGLKLQATREFGNYGAASLGVERLEGSAQVEIGDPSIESYDFSQGNLFASLNIDRLDSLYFPQEGYFALLGYRTSREWLGSDSEFDQIDFDAVGAKSFGEHSVQLGARYHTTASGVLPVQSRYRLGGKTRLVGFRLNELTGQHYAVIFAGYTYQLASFFGRSALIGATAEYGNAWERREDMAFDDGIFNASIYTGFDSWLGPMQLGVGWREHGDGVLFLEIGRPF